MIHHILLWNSCQHNNVKQFFYLSYLLFKINLTVRQLNCKFADAVFVIHMCVCVYACMRVCVRTCCVCIHLCNISVRLRDCLIPRFCHTTKLDLRGYWHIRSHDYFHACFYSCFLVPVCNNTECNMPAVCCVYSSVLTYPAHVAHR